MPAEGEVAHVLRPLGDQLRAGGAGGVDRRRAIVEVDGGRFAGNGRHGPSPLPGPRRRCATSSGPDASSRRASASAAPRRRSRPASAARPRPGSPPGRRPSGSGAITSVATTAARSFTYAGALRDRALQAEVVRRDPLVQRLRRRLRLVGAAVVGVEGDAELADARVALAAELELLLPDPHHVAARTRPGRTDSTAAPASPRTRSAVPTPIWAIRVSGQRRARGGERTRQSARTTATAAGEAPGAIKTIPSRSSAAAAAKMKTGVPSPK